VNLGGSVTETRRYDTTGNLVIASTSCCEQTTILFTSDTHYAYPQSKTRGSAIDPYAQLTISGTYDLNTGLGRSSTDANGRVSQINYDPNTLRPSTSISPTGAHTDLDYDDAAMTVASTTYLAAGEGGGIADQSVKYLNGLGLVRQEKGRGPNNGQPPPWDAVDTTYNNLGQVSQQSRPYRLGVESPVFSTATYDALGRTTRVFAPDGSVTETYYNEKDFDTTDSYVPQRPDAASTSAGETTLVRDAWGRERWGRTDSRGRLVEVVEPNPNGSGSVATGGMVTTYSYSTLGSLTQTNQGAQTRSFNYDSLGRLIAQKLAETSATLNDSGTYVGSGSWSDVFTYDSRSNLTSRTDARGVKAVYSYNNDPLNRLQSVSWDTSGFGDTSNPIFGAATVSYSYRTKASPSDPKDVTQLNSVSAAGVSTESYLYDTEGRVYNQTLTLSGRSSYPFLTNYSYDSLDRVTGVQYPAEYGNGSAPRKAIHHTYDIASRLTDLTYDGQSFASNIVYNGTSQTTSLNVGSGTNQITESYSYNAQTGLLDNQTVARGATTLLNLSYDYANSNGKRTGQLTKILNNLNHNKDRGYSYDALGRLVQATGGPSTGTLWTQTYTYDRYGNRLSVSASGNSAKLSEPESRNVNGQLAVAKPADPKVELPTNLLAKNTGVALPADGSRSTVREASESLSDASISLFNPAATKSSTNAPPPADPPTYTNNPLVAGITVQVVHITELRDTIDALRLRRGLSAYAWPEAIATNTFIKADHILQMRTALDQALGAPSSGYSAGLVVGQPILAIHIQELRDRVNNAWNSDSSCPPGQTLLIEQFIKNFYQGALNRQPNSNELQSWGSQLRQAYYQGQSQLRATAQYMGRQLFKSQAYADRGRDNHWYVYDLYWAYMQRQPDTSGWNYWKSVINSDIQNGLDGRGHARVAFETDSTEFFPKLASLCPGSSGSAPIPLDGLANLTYDTASNHITTAGFSYDAAGNQTRTVRTDGSAQRFQYDSANRLIQIRDDYGYTLQTFTYGDSSERLISDEGGYRTYYAGGGGTPVAEYIEVSSSTTPAWSKSYVYLGARLLSTITPNGSGAEAAQYHYPDRLGTRLVTDPASGTSSEQVTLPFGTPLNSESTGATNHRFTSYDRSSTTGLDYALNRHYDPQQGRFTQVDPLGMKAARLENPQTLNLYSYVGNDPVNHVDPDGLFWKALKRFIKTLVLTLVAVLVVVVIVLAVATVAPSLLPFVLKPVVLGLLAIVAQHLVLTVFNGISDEVNAHGFSIGSLFRGFGKGLLRFFKSIANFPKGVLGIGFYGNYCGNANPNQSSGREPIDALDGACIDHDRVYQSTTDGRTRARADLRLAKAAFLAGFRVNRIGQLFAFFVVVGFGLKGFLGLLFSNGRSEVATTVNVSGDSGERPNFTSPAQAQYRVTMQTYPEIMSPGPFRVDRFRSQPGAP
jgi:RHS repeat-associated protein